MDTHTKADAEILLVRTATQFHRELAVHELPHSAFRLACAACGRELHDHSGRPPDCAGFLRPSLPSGYAYASGLRAGTAFRFLNRRSEGRTQVAQRDAAPLDDENGLIELRLADTDATTYLVQGTTVVRLALAPAVSAA